MTAKELITELKKFKDSVEVMIYLEDGKILEVDTIDELTVFEDVDDVVSTIYDGESTSKDICIIYPKSKV